MNEPSGSRSHREASQPPEPGQGQRKPGRRRRPDRPAVRPGGAIPAAAIAPARQAGPARQSRIVWSLIGLKVAGDALRSRRSHELAIVGAIALAALAHQARENQTQILARLIAWDRRQVQALHRQFLGRPGRRRTR
jgi:hypothetical protein